MLTTYDVVRPTPWIITNQYCEIIKLCCTFVNHYRIRSNRPHSFEHRLQSKFQYCCLMILMIIFRTKHQKMGIPYPRLLGHIVAYSGNPYWLVLNVLSTFYAEFRVISIASSCFQSLSMTNTKRRFSECLLLGS